MNNVKGLLFAIVSSATFGLVPLFSIPLLKAGVGTPTILFYRMGIAALLMGLIARGTHRRLKIGFKDMMIFLALGGLYAATSLWLLMSYEFIPSGMATTIHFLYPLVVTLVMILFFREKCSLWLIVAAVLSVAGVALLSWGEEDSSATFRGISMVLVTVVTYACYIVGVNKTRVVRMDSVVLTFYVLLSAATMFLVYAATTTGIERLPSFRLAGDALLLALLPTVVSNLALVLAVKNIGSTMTAILGSMEPLTAILVGVFYFGETFGTLSAAGLCLIVTAVIIVILHSKSRTAK
ncbi:EamA family transporter [Gallalistipes aquisgranensis]|uniref:EamA family transporter n=1 Tax=Gallalistipes aquisgranensis TaxID=2779358 RepID=UPI001CF851F6|nr:DMT family transporter [Gallalistipes aquisgranensis]MBE5033111.1 DMT family transporter [Gallalistipes aquisgranensis]